MRRSISRTKQDHAGNLHYFFGASYEKSNYTGYGALPSWLDTIKDPEYLKTKVYAKLTYFLGRDDHKLSLFAQHTSHSGDLGRPNRDFLNAYDTANATYANQINPWLGAQLKAGLRSYDRKWGSDNYDSSKPAPVANQFALTEHDGVKQTILPADLTFSASDVLALCERRRSILRQHLAVQAKGIWELRRSQPEIAEDVRRARLPGRRGGGAQQHHQQEVRPALEFPGSWLQWDGLRAGSDVTGVVHRALVLGSIIMVATLQSSTYGATTESAPKVVIELFQVTLVDDASIRYVRRSAALNSRGPDAIVAELLRCCVDSPRFFASVPTIVHSTSWRYEEGGTVVLTYLAYGENVNPSVLGRKDTQAIKANELPGIGTTDPDKPRPASLAHEDVLAHGLRHLALLARRKGGDKFVRLLGERSRKFFSSIEPELAGQIGGSNMLVPSSTGAR